MVAFVTGGSGFIGYNLIRELVQDGHTVRALYRSSEAKAMLKGAGAEPVSGSLLDRPALAKAMKGCDWCFHVAASYSLWLPQYRSMYETNVEGTRTVLQAAGDAGCSRVVYTSTVGCIGLPRAHNGTLEPSDETSPVGESQLSNPYKRSKWQAEKIALELAGRGLPVTIVNPSAPVGPFDVKPTPTGRMIVDFLQGRMPAYMDTGLNWVHVRDVARGHILAAEIGRFGQRYILGHQSGNWTMQETLAVLSELTGLSAPRVRLPYGVALSAAWLSEGLARLTRTPPRAPLGAVRMAKYKMFFNPSKAVQELGLPQTPPRQAFEEAIAWFRRNGHAT